MPFVRAHCTDRSTIRDTPSSTFARCERFSAADHAPSRGLIDAKDGLICVAVSRRRARASSMKDSSSAILGRTSAIQSLHDREYLGDDGLSPITRIPCPYMTISF